MLTAIVIAAIVIVISIGGLIAKLSKVNQRNEKLKSELEQTKQKYQGSELGQAYQEIERLKQEQQHNVAFAKKLEASEQRCETLDNDLEQEKQAKGDLTGCSAYRTLLDAIYSARGVETDGEKQECRQELQKASEQLGKEYLKPEKISPDYSKVEYQEAYLLRYFLPYSQPVPYLLNHLMLRKNFSCQLPDGALTASFFGCGPGPELFGLMRYLGGPESGLNISSAMLDRCDWKPGRKIVREYLLPESYDIREFTSDLVGDAKDFLPGDSGEWVSKSDLVVMQHCLNERDNVKQEQLMKNLKQLVAKMKPGAVMLIIERAGYQKVKDALGKFLHQLEKFDIEKEAATERPVKIKPILEVIPVELATDFFTERSSNSVNSVKFIWMAISKK